MKKYQQLLLAILSIFSFSCLLIYRHEYNKLRYVLEVLNFFGTPSVSSSAPLVCSKNDTLVKFFISDNPLPAWQRISNSLYIYSAYWEKVDDNEHVKAFAIGVLNENLNYGCYLWYDSDPKTKTGQFSFSGIAYKPQDVANHKSFGKSRAKAFVFYCEAETKGVGTPVGVTFYRTSLNETHQGFLPVANLLTGSPPQNSTGICVMPSPFLNFNRSNYLEFLSFHKIIGINNFIIYGSNNQHRLLSSIQKHASNKLELSVLQWNYPFFRDSELMRVIAENDCKTRTIGLFENVIILDWDKFIVPHYLFSISKILNVLDHENKTYKFQFSSLLFCSEYEDNVKSNFSSSMLFKKTRYSLSKIDLPIPAYRPYRRTGRVQKVSRDIISVHQYNSCRDIKIKSDGKSSKIDTSMLRFQNKLMNSQLLGV